MSAPSPAPAATSTTAVPSAAAREATKALPPTRVTAADGTMDETADDIVVHSHDDYDDDDAQPSSGWAALRNKNVSRVLVFCFLDGASHSIWRQDPFQVLIKQLGGDTAVGWMAACSGVTQMAAALVAGYIGNTVQHEVVLRVGSIVGYLTIALSIVAASRLSLVLFFVSQALCGVYSGISATTMEALFADSVATGRRAFVYNLKWMDQVLSSCVGLVICISVLFSLGNQWEQSALVKTMFVGLCLHPVAMSVLWTLRDRYSLREDEEGVAEAVVVLTEVEGREGRVRKSASEVELLHSGLHDDAPYHSPADTRTAATGAVAAAEDTPWSTAPGRPSAIRRSGQDAGSSGSGSGGKRVHWSTTPPAVVDSPAAADSASPTTATAAAAAAGAASPSGRPPRSSRQRAVQCALEESCEAAKQEFFAQLRAAQGNYLLQLRHAASYYGLVIFTWEAVPYLVCLVDFLVAFGSGMTMRYMSLFFVEDYKTTPVVLLTASLLVSPLTALISFVVQRMGDLYVGRLPSTIIVRFIGVTLLLLMGVTNLPLNIMLPIYIFRNALMNSTSGVTRSVIMDCVRKENRAKWSAFESFSSFTWAGSAVFGGYIAAAHGYKGTFTITAFFHYCSLAVLVPGAIGALPVERELMRSNRTKPHASCLVVTVAVCVIMVIASGFYAWFRSEVAKRNW